LYLLYLQLILVSNKKQTGSPADQSFGELVLALHNPGYFLAPRKHSIKEHARIPRLLPLSQQQELGISSLSITSITLFVRIIILSARALLRRSSSSLAYGKKLWSPYFCYN